MKFFNLKERKELNKLSQDEFDNIWRPHFEINDIDVFFREENKIPSIFVIREGNKSDIMPFNVLTNANVLDGNLCTLQNKITVR